MLHEKPSSKPNWVSSTPLSIEEPDAAKKLSGFTIEKPPFQFFNWFWNLVSEWVEYVDSIDNSSALFFTCDNQGELSDVLNLLKVMNKNTHTIQITCTFLTITDNIVISDIKGTGTIIIQPPNPSDVFTINAGIRITNVENKIVFLGHVVSENNYLIYRPGIELKNAALVQLTKLDCTFGMNMNSNGTSKIQAIALDNSLLNVGSLSVDVGNPGELLPKYAVVLKNNSVLHAISSAYFTASGTTDPTYAFAYIYFDKTSKLLGSNYTFVGNKFFAEVYSEYLDEVPFGDTVKMFMSNTAKFNVEQMLTSLKSLNVTLEVNFNSETTANPLVIKNVKGAGILKLRNLNCTRDKRITVANCSCSVDIDVLYLHVINDYEYVGFTASCLPFLRIGSITTRVVSVPPSLHPAVLLDRINNCSIGTYIIPSDTAIMGGNCYIQAKMCMLSINTIEHKFHSTAEILSVYAGTAHIKEATHSASSPETKVLLHDGGQVICKTTTSPDAYVVTTASVTEVKN